MIKISPMKKTTKYLANAIAKVRLSDSLWKLIKIPITKFNSKAKLLSVVSETMYEGNENNGIYTKGIVLEIIKETRTDDEDEVFISREYEFQSVGNLTDAEYFEMQEILLNKTK